MNTAPGFTTYTAAWQQGLLPDPPLWIDEWADAHMIIPASTGAAESGKYRVDRTPHARAVMRSLSPGSRCRNVVVLGASQMLKTQVGLNWVCAIIDRAPANAIAMEPTDLLSRRLSARFDKTVAEIPSLREKVAPPKSRDKTNRTDTKDFRGGTLWITTAGSISNLKEAPARYVWADEVVDLKKNLKGQGNVVGLLAKRTGTYGRNAKAYFTSSGGIEGESEITDLYHLGDQRKPLARCPHCDEMQVLVWERFIYDLGEGWIYYACEKNGCRIEEHSKPEMFAEGLWQATAPGDGETESYWIPYWYAPLGWDPWLKVAREFEAAKEAASKGDTEPMQVWMNTRAAMDYGVTTGAMEPETLKKRAEAECWPLGIAPRPVVVLTAAVDVQHNRLEIQIIGWGWGPCGMEAWTIAVHVIQGNTVLDDPWRTLDELLKTPVRHAGGALLTMRAVLVDASDGNRSDEILEFTRHRSRRWINGNPQNVLAIKGASKPGKPVISAKPSKVDINYRGRYIPQGAELWTIGTETAKDWIFNRLEMDAGAFGQFEAVEYPVHRHRDRQGLDIQPT